MTQPWSRRSRSAARGGGWLSASFTKTTRGGPGGARVQTLRGVAESEGVPISAALHGAPSAPTAPGPIHEALSGFAREGAVRLSEARGQSVYQADEDQRLALVFYKNNLMNLLAPRALVAAAVRAGPATDAVQAVEARALFLSRL